MTRRRPPVPLRSDGALTHLTRDREWSWRVLRELSVVAWDPEIVFRPALVRLGGVILEAPQRLAFERLLGSATRALRRLLETVVSCECAADAAPPSGRPELAIELEISGRRTVIAVHESAARPLASSLMLRAAGLVGTGPLRESERGLLEYAALHIVRQLADHAAFDAEPEEVDSGLRLLGFHHGSETVAVLDSEPLFPLPLRTFIAGQVGWVVVWIEGLDPATLPGLPVADDAPLTSGPSSACGLSVVLPPVRVAADEVRSLEPGDVILLGTTELSALADRCRLRTATGWDLARVRILENGPRSLRVDRGVLTPTVASPLAVSADETCLVVSTGQAELVVDDLRSWSEGAPLELPREVHAPWRVRHGRRGSWTAEMVVVGSELGLRLLSEEPAS